MLITDIQHIRKSKIKTQISDRKRAISERTEGREKKKRRWIKAVNFIFARLQGLSNSR